MFQLLITATLKNIFAWRCRKSRMQTTPIRGLSSGCLHLLAVNWYFFPMLAPVYDCTLY